MLLEQPTRKIEILELDYGEVLYNETKKYEEPNSEYSSVVLSNYHYNKTSVVTATLKMEHTEGNKWTHSVQFGILRSSTLRVNFNMVNDALSKARIAPIVTIHLIPGGCHRGS